MCILVGSTAVCVCIPHAQELATMRKRAYTMDTSVDVTDYSDDFAERLQTAIDEAREEIERETEQYRLDLERSYKDKVGPVEFSPLHVLNVYTQCT